MSYHGLGCLGCPGLGLDLRTQQAATSSGANTGALQPENSWGGPGAFPGAQDTLSTSQSKVTGLDIEVGRGASQSGRPLPQGGGSKGSFVPSVEPSSRPTLGRRPPAFSVAQVPSVPLPLAPLRMPPAPAPTSVAHQAPPSFDQPATAAETTPSYSLVAPPRPLGPPTGHRGPDIVPASNEATRSSAVASVAVVAIVAAALVISLSRSGA